FGSGGTRKAFLKAAPEPHALFFDFDFKSCYTAASPKTPHESISSLYHPACRQHSGDRSVHNGRYYGTRRESRHAYSQHRRRSRPSLPNASIGGGFHQWCKSEI